MSLTGSYISDNRRKDVEGAVDHDVVRESGDDSPWLEVWGNNKNYNINPILHHNIVMCDYFKVINREIHSFRRMLEEIEREVSHLEPYTINGPLRSASTAWCILFKAFMMRVTEKQMAEMLDPAAPPYIRGIGFLYLRLTCVPKNLWGWLEPYIQDQRTLVVGRPGGKGSQEPVTVEKFILQLLLDQEFCDTVFPRMPTAVLRDIQARIVEIKTGVKADAKKDEIEYTVGMKVKAQFYEDQQWYDNAQIAEVLPDNKFLVTFLDYGNQDECTREMLQPKGKYGKKRAAPEKSQDEIDLDKMLNKEKYKATELYDGKYNARRPKVDWNIP